MLLPPDAAGVIIMQMPTAMAFVIMQVQAAPIMRMPMGMEYAIIMEPHKAGILWMPMEMGFAIIIPMAYVLEMAWDKGAASAADATDGTDKTIMRSEQEVNRAVEQYSDMVQRLCMIHLKNRADTEDIFQTVFLKYVLSSVSFESQEHGDRSPQGGTFLRKIPGISGASEAGAGDHAGGNPGHVHAGDPGADRISGTGQCLGRPGRGTGRQRILRPGRMSGNGTRPRQAGKGQK